LILISIDEEPTRGGAWRFCTIFKGGDIRFKAE